jgi:ketosteroid isomerase-like protein
MYKCAVRTMIRRNVRALASGDVRPLLGGYAKDGVLVFPGTSSWGCEHHGKAAIEAFLQRFVAAGITGEVHDILVNGPPCWFWVSRTGILH